MRTGISILDTLLPTLVVAMALNGQVTALSRNKKNTVAKSSIAIRNEFRELDYNYPYFIMYTL